MRQLYYTNYQSGNSGLSNGIMSIECGVVMAFLTKRFLLLDGNASPPANIVSYGGRVDNSVPSRVTDLLDIPVPWAEPDPGELAGIASSELTRHHLMDSVFYVPGTVDIHSRDALEFARGRSNWICEDRALADVPLLRVSEQPMTPDGQAHRHNLNFYSYLFYLDDENRRAVYQLLARMQAQQPYADLAGRVARDLGEFNAVHMRRGDFKVTYGVTVLDRSPWEAIEAMDPHFSRSQRLLICTDERDDPFFTEITQAWSDHIFVDHHILDNYASDFAALPRHDSLALAYLSQLVAAESTDFIGTMTSTFTAMIQRLRGSSGKPEQFKYLWNELAQPGDQVERGSHPISDCIPMEDGVMIEEFEGSYSWNRVSSLINPAWMREWPESFLLDQVLASGRLNKQGATAQHVEIGTQYSGVVTTFFSGIGIRLQCSVPGLAARLTRMFSSSASASDGGIIADMRIDWRSGYHVLESRGAIVAQVLDEADVPAAILDYLVPILCRLRKGHSWFDGMALEKDGKVILFAGDWRRQSGGSAIADGLIDAGWLLLGDEAVPVRAEDATAVPFAICAGNAGSPRSSASGLAAIVYGSRQVHSRNSLFALSPSVAVAELARSSRDFAFQRDDAVKRLCTLVEQVPVYQLNYCREEDTPEQLASLLRHLPVVADEAHA